MRVAVTGAAGRLGRATVRALRAPARSTTAIPWTRSEFDLDSPAAFGALLHRDRPDVVIHCAAWTDVDACARQPALAIARNGTATAALATECVRRDVKMLLISTNEVFDGRRRDGNGYRPDETPCPMNAYGRSKLSGEVGAREVFDGAAAALVIVRTAWLFGPPGNDFPARILEAARRAATAGEPLRLVSDEVGSPSFTDDVADGVVEWAEAVEPSRVVHAVNTGRASRAQWAREVLRLAGVSVETIEVPASSWVRASTPPTWAVLEPSPTPSGRVARPWLDALAEYVPAMAAPGTRTAT